MSKLVPVPNAEVEEVLLNSGLIYAINKLVLHPMGMALALSFDEDGSNFLEIMLMRMDDGDYLDFSPETHEASKDKFDMTITGRINSRLGAATQEELLLLANLQQRVLGRSK